MNDKLNNDFVGSNWNVWDLHVHSPASYEWKGEKFGQDPTKNEKILETWINTINKSDAVAFGIVDYFTIEGYLKLRQYLHENNIKLSKAIFPGIELRVDASTDCRLNIQVLFSNELSNQKLQDFISTLKILEYPSHPKLSIEAIVNFARGLSPDKAKIHGFESPEKLTDKELLELGYKTAVIAKDSLIEGIKQLEGSCMVVLPFDSYSGITEVDWKKHEAEVTYYFKLAHVFEGRKNEFANIAAGQVTENNKNFIENFNKTAGGPKPTICGSDAHKFENYGTFPQSQKTWIKGLATWNGLRQIIFEPSSRVRIQPNRPEQKNDLYIIKSIAFEDESGTFQKGEIGFNPNLNAIIGGKSTGKSLLLYYLARTINKAEFEKSIDKIPDLKYVYHEHGINFKVTWADNRIDSLTGIREITDRNIVYLPQERLSILSKPQENRVKNDLNKYIENILRQDSGVNSIYETFIQNLRRIDGELNKALSDFFVICNSMKESKAQLVQLTDVKGLEKAVESIKADIERLRKATQLNEEQQKEFAKYSNELESAINRKKLTQEECSNLKDRFLPAFSQLNESHIKVLNFTEVIKDEEFADRVVAILGTQGVALSELGTEISKYYNEADNGVLNIKLKEIEKEINLLSTHLDKLKMKFDQREEVEIKEKELASFEGRRDRAIFLEEKVNLLKADRSKAIQNLIQIHSKYLQEHLMMLESFKSSSDAMDDMKVEPKIRVRNYLNEKLLVAVDKRISNLDEIKALLEIGKPEELEEKVKVVLSLILNEEVQFKASHTFESAMRALFDPKPFYFDWEVSYKGDSFGKMSQGKSNLVLLKIFVSLSNSKWPILIDQPENDLDNRSIVRDLVGYLKEKKIERQIVVVTHNPNVVLGADAECVIVANQEGQDDARINNKYKFEYIEGPIENSFRDMGKRGILNQMGIREHICEVLEGGKEAFQMRERKYGFAD